MLISNYISLYPIYPHVSYINISWGFNQPLPEVTPATIGNPRQAAEQCDESGNAAKIGLPTGESFNGSIASGYIYIIYMGFP